MWSEGREEKEGEKREGREMEGEWRKRVWRGERRGEGAGGVEGAGRSQLLIESKRLSSREIPRLKVKILK